MTVSAQIKSFLLTNNIKRAACCTASFDAGLNAQLFKELCPGCRASYIAGVFVGLGTVTDPSKGFHLELKVPKAIAGRVASILDEEGLTPHACSLRSGKVRLYYKASAQISDFLTYIGAVKFALEVLESEVIKNVRGRENRKSNAELANIDRSATAAAEQIQAITNLKKHGALSQLSEELVLTAKIREQNPFMSLDELRQELSPPISKSGLSHRLKRIIEEADRLGKEV